MAKGTFADLIEFQGIIHGLEIRSTLYLQTTATCSYLAYFPHVFDQ